MRAFSLMFLHLFGNTTVTSSTINSLQQITIQGQSKQRLKILLVHLPRQHTACPLAPSMQRLSTCPGHAALVHLPRACSACPLAPGMQRLSTCPGHAALVHLPRACSACPLARDKYCLSNCPGKILLVHLPKINYFGIWIIPKKFRENFNLC